MRGRVRHLKTKSLGATASYDSRYISGLSSGNAVSSWSDLSGNGNTASQATSAKQPTYQTAVFGGQPSVRFDGADDQLTHNANNSSSCVIFSAYQKRSTQTGYRGVCAFGPSGSTGTMLLSVVNSGNWGTYTTTNAPASTLIANSTPSLCVVEDNGASGGSFYLNGSSDGTWTGNTIGQLLKHIGGDATQEANIDVGMVLLTEPLSNPLRKLIEKSIGFSFKIACS